MKKGFLFYFICWLTLVMIFNVITFVTPGEIAGVSKYTGSFWLGYLIIMLAFIGQLAITWYAVLEENATRTFYRIPLISVSISSMIAITICGTICMAVSIIPTWIGTIACLVAFGISLIAVVSTEATVSYAEKAGKKVRINTFYMRALESDMADLVERTTTTEIRNEVKIVHEAVKYSNTMSNEALADIETKITLKVKKLADAIADADYPCVKRISEEILVLLKERDKKCMLLKRVM